MGRGSAAGHNTDSGWMAIAIDEHARRYTFQGRPNWNPATDCGNGGGGLAVGVTVVRVLEGSLALECVHAAPAPAIATTASAPTAASSRRTRLAEIMIKQASRWYGLRTNPRGHESSSETPKFAVTRDLQAFFPAVGSCTSEHRARFDDAAAHPQTRGFAMAGDLKD
jgi:hypothetical protein